MFRAAFFLSVAFLLSLFPSKPLLRGHRTRAQFLGLLCSGGRATIRTGSLHCRKCFYSEDSISRARCFTFLSDLIPILQENRRKANAFGPGAGGMNGHEFHASTRSHRMEPA